MRPRTLLCLAAVTAACTRGRSAHSDHVPTIIGAVDLDIGGEKDSAAQFSLVNGLEVDASGRIFVSDRRRRDVRVFSPNGHLLLTIGRRGKGPGEFEAPCCLTIAPDGRLWVADGILLRYSLFDIDRDRIRYAGMRTVVETGGDVSIGLDVTPHLAWVADTVIGMGPAADRKPGGSLLAWTYWDPNGTQVRQVPLPAPPPTPPRRTVTATITVDGHRAELSTSIAHPFDPHWLFAQAGDGTWAVGSTGSRYEVDVFDRDGHTLGHIARDVVGDPLERADLDWATEEVAADLRRSKIPESASDIPAPARIPVITALFFDRVGRLWVQRGNHHAAPHTADVYDSHGSLVATAHWPGDIELARGVVTRDWAFGVREGSDDDGPHVVRLRLTSK